MDDLRFGRFSCEGVEGGDGCVQVRFRLCPGV